jgi:hypothetical protein
MEDKGSFALNFYLSQKILATMQPLSLTRQGGKICKEWVVASQQYLRNLLILNALIFRLCRIPLPPAHEKDPQSYKLRRP